MKKIFALSLAVFLFIITTFAQPTGRQRIQDSVIGWEKIYSFKGKQYKSLVVEGQTFTTYQQSLRDSFIIWMQRTFKPIGGMGGVREREYTSVQRHGPVPQGIGADFYVCNVKFDKPKGNLVRIPDQCTGFYFYTNTLPGINKVTVLKGVGTFYFTMPKWNYGSTFTDPELIKYVKEYGLHEDDRFKKFMVYFDGVKVNVVLAPGNQLPIKQLTKGELLQALEDAIPVITANEKEDRSTNKFEQDRVEAELKPHWIKTIASMKEKYKNKFDEPAYVTTQYGPTTADLYSVDEDFFVEGNPQYAPGFAVYRFNEPALKESIKDKPLWVSISWQPQKPTSNQPADIGIHKAMLTRFNFEYVYDYFFNAEKVKGISYAPLSSIQQ